MATQEANTRRQLRRGTLCGFLCYVLWGSFPLYWKLLANVDPLEIIAHRIIWCFVFTVLLCALLRQNFARLLRDRRALAFLLPAALLITLNWGTYIYAVAVDRILETAIGYYINPLVSIVLGMIVFKERLTRLQAIAVALCIIGIGFFTVNYGSFPVFAIVLALSFGLYGAIKKKGGYPAVEALAVENTLMLVPALIFVVAMANVTGSHGFLGMTAEGVDWRTTLLLIGGGAVTAIPLILFAKAANSIPLTLLGFIQYISPTIAMLLGVFVNGEPFTLAHGVCFGCIWCGLALVAVDAVRASRKASASQPSLLEQEQAAYDEETAQADALTQAAEPHS